MQMKFFKYGEINGKYLIINIFKVFLYIYLIMIQMIKQKNFIQIISKIPQQETSKIQQILKKMENNYSINNTNNNNEIEEDEKTIDKNNEVSNNKDNDFNDIDGEPL